MSWIAVSIGVGTAGASIYGANKAADAQGDASAAQIALAREQYAEQNKKAKHAASKIGTRNAKTLKSTTKLARQERNALTSYAEQTRDATLGEAQTAYNRNMPLLTKARDDTLGLFRPAQEAGNNALAAYSYNLRIGSKPAGYTGLETSAGTKFLLNEGRKEIEGGAAGSGGLFSGATLAALDERRNGLVAQDKNNQMSQLFGLVGTGQTAAGNMADATGRYAGAIAGLNDQDYARRSGAFAGYGADMGRAQVGYTDRATNAQNIYADRYANNWNNWVNAGAQASNNYTSTSVNALSAYGNAQAGRAYDTVSAINSGINNGFGVYGMLGGNFNKPENLAQGNGWAMNKPPMARPY